MMERLSYFKKRNIPQWQVILTSMARRFLKKDLEVFDQAINPHPTNSAGDPLSRAFFCEKK
jgi:hypothetical protein